LICYSLFRRNSITQDSYQDSRKILALFEAERTVERLNAALEDYLLEEFPLDRMRFFWKTMRHRHFQVVSGVLSLDIGEREVLAQLPELKKEESGFAQFEKSRCNFVYIQSPTGVEALLCYDASEELQHSALRFVLSIWCTCREKLFWEQEVLQVTQKLSKIRTISKELGKAQDLKNILSKILKMTISLVDAQKGFIMLQNEATQLLHLEVVHGLENAAAEKLINEGKLPTEGIPAGKGVQGKVFQTRKPTIIDEITDFRSMGLERDTHSILCVPLISNDEAIGVVYVTNKRDMTRFEPLDLDLITILAGNVSQVVDQARLYKKAVTDHLTGMYTRRYMDTKIASEIKRSRRFRHPLCIIMVDADHFKNINDTYGHDAGDEVLRKIAEVLNNSIRVGVDVAGRMGGEEFTILLPETPLQGGMVVAERIRNAMEKQTVLYKGKQLKITLSLGLAGLAAEDQEISYRELLRQADSALYKGKQNGRNQSVVYTEEDDTK
jgi:diguanylate cyclase (GGDEF)-like protein